MRTALSIVLLLLGATPSWSAFETLVAVVQPVESDGGAEPVVTTYSAYFASGQEAVTRLQLTLAPNAIINSLGVPVERNLAHGQGIKFHCTTSADTLVVRVDLTKAKPSDPDPKYAARGIALVLWCGLRNVRAAWPSVHYVRYELEGNPFLEHYAGVYDLERVHPFVAKDTWDLATFGPDGQRPIHDR